MARTNRLCTLPHAECVGCVTETVPRTGWPKISSGACFALQCKMPYERRIHASTYIQTRPGSAQAAMMLNGGNTSACNSSLLLSAAADVNHPPAKAMAGEAHGYWLPGHSIGESRCARPRGRLIGSMAVCYSRRAFPGGGQSKKERRPNAVGLAGKDAG